MSEKKWFKVTQVSAINPDYVRVIAYVNDGPYEGDGYVYTQVQESDIPLEHRLCELLTDQLCDELVRRGYSVQIGKKP